MMRAIATLFLLASLTAEGRTLTYDNRSADAQRELTLRLDGSRLVVVDDRTRSVVAAAPAAETERVAVRGAAGSHDDTLTVDLSLPFSLPGGIDYDGGADGWDTLVLTGGATHSETITQLTPHDGIVDLDGLVVRYTNLEPVTDTAPASTLIINGTAGVDTVTVSDGPGPGQATISSPTFESITFSNKVNVIFDGMGGGDSFTFSNPTPPAALSTFIVRNVATVDQTAPVHYRDLGVSATGDIDLFDNNDVDNIEVVTQNGAINYRDADGVRIGGVSSTLSGLRVTNNGFISIQTGGTIELADTDGPDVVRAGAVDGASHNNVILQAFGSGSDVIVTVDLPAITAPRGSISVSAHGDILLGTAGADFDNDVRGFGDVRLTASDIVLSGQANVVAGEFGNPSPVEAEAQTSGELLVSDATGTGASFGSVGSAQTLVRGRVRLTVQNPSALFSETRAVFLQFIPRLIIAPGSGISTPSTVVIFTTGPVDLGSTTDAMAALEISDAEVDRIATPQLHIIGNGGITVTQAITFAGSLRLTSDDTFTATGTGSLDAAALDFQDTGGAGRTWTINAASITISPGAPIPYSGASTLRTGGFGGSDTFNVTPSATTAFHVDGSTPVPPDTPGDTLDVETAGTTTPFLSYTSTSSGYNGTYTFGNRAPVTFEGIETLDAETDLAVTKSDGQTSDTAGTTLTYTITVSNLGPLGVNGISVVDTLPPALHDVTWTCNPSPGAACTGSGTGNLNETVSIPAGGTVTFHVSGEIDSSATGSLTNTVTVAPPDGTTDPNAANDSATDTNTLTAAADLAVAKNTMQRDYIRGGTITWTIAVANLGPSDAVDVELTDVLPAGTTFSSIEGPWPCTTPAPGTHGTITCTAGIMGADVTETFTLVVRVDPDASGEITNTATVSAATTDPDPANDAEGSSVGATVAIPTLTDGVLLLFATLLAAAALRRL